MFDFFDVSTMERLRWELLCVHRSTNGEKYIESTTPTNLNQISTDNISYKEDEDMGDSSQDNEISFKETDLENTSNLRSRTRSSSLNSSSISTPSSNVNSKKCNSLNNKNTSNCSTVKSNGIESPSTPLPSNCSPTQHLHSTPKSTNSSQPEHSFQTDCITFYPTVSQFNLVLLLIVD